MRLYSVINIDIVGSRKLNDRENIQNLIKEYLNNFSNKYINELVAPVTLTLGDEWQIVLMKVEMSYEVAKEIQDFLRSLDIECYVGVGIGAISTELDTDTRLMDGSAFIYARQALNIAKNKNRYYSNYLNSKENRIFFMGEEIILSNDETFIPLNEVAITSSNDSEYITLNNLINCIIENNEVIESKFTKKQLEIIKLYKEAGSYNLILKNMPKLSKASISQKLNTSNYFLTQYNRKIIKLLISKYVLDLKGRLNGS